ncbi:major facilitator superfamily domain-containing protein 6-A [Onthophagus taurus]|uniref:major facilitator superfamily domain-containing protein 6-A n=1 Tax=Onthophagus taurus TaxID=166361 RepID=UPI0039BE3C4E
MLDFKINRKMLYMKLHYFFWNAGTAPIVPFLSIYARQLGISSTIVGVMYTVMTIMGMLAKPLFGAIADRYRCQKMIFLTFILVTAAAFLATYHSPSIAVERPMHLACDQSYAFLDTCNANNTCTVEELLLEVGENGSIQCDINCEMKPEYYKTVCEGWKVDKYCGEQSGDHLEFSVILPIQHFQHMGSCLYFKIQHAIFDNKQYYPNCVDAAHHISTMCDVKCNEFLLNEILKQPTVENNEFYHTYEFWLVFLFMIIGWVGQAIVVSVTDAVCFAMLENQPNKYGVQRSFGALGWGVFSIISGFMIDTSSSGTSKYYLPVFYLGASLLIVDFIISLNIKYTQKEMTTRIFHDVALLFKNIRIIIFVVFCIFVGMCTGLIWNFFFWLIEDLAKSQGCGYMEWIKTLEGLIMGVQCLLGELPFFFVSGSILKRIGHVHAMTVILCVMGIRFVLYSVISNPWYFLPIELLNGVTYGLFYAAMASYASIVAPPGTETTMQGLFGAVFEGVGVSLGSLLGGQLLEEVGGVWTFRIFGISSLSLCVVHAALQFIMRKSPQDSEVQYAAPLDAINIINGQWKS